MNFYVTREVLDIGVKIVFATVRGLDNTAISDEWVSYREEKLRQLLARYQGIDFHEDAVFEGFHILHDNSGVRRRKNVPASENLVRLLLKHGDMPFINPAVDVYNLISMDTKLALGAHNLDAVEGNVTLRLTDGTERFLPIGQSAPIAINPHEYCYCDDANEVLCRLEVRQVEKTKVDENTKNVFYIIQGNAATDDALLEDTAKQIIDTTVRYFGGVGEILVAEVVV